MTFFVTCLFLLTFSIAIVQGRILSLNTDPNSYLISDGVDHHVEYQPPSLVALAPNTAQTAVLSICKHQYGFLPCVENFWGYVFMILVYQGLLIHGEMLIGSGCGVLANIVGTVENLNGAKAGHVLLTILMSLPPMILMIVSGVFSSKEGAQSMVSVGVGIYAGVTVFSLTVQWAVCVMCGKKDPQAKGTGRNSLSFLHFSVKQALNFFKDTAVIEIDVKTQYTAGIMLLSLIPYLIVQLDIIFKTSNPNVTLIALIASSVSLVSYFIYQIWDPWSIQERHLEHLKHELRTEFLEHLQRHGEFVDDKGELNNEVLKKLYADVDKNSDNYVTEDEVQKLVEDIFMNGKVKVGEKFAVSELMKSFKFEGKSKISEEDFIEGCKSLIGEANERVENCEGSSSNIVHEIMNLFKENKLEDSQERARIMSNILKHAEEHILKSEALVTHDGKPNDEQIKILFRRYDTDGDNGISPSELEKLLKEANFGETPVKYENVVKDLFSEFDKDDNHVIDESEFSEGIKKWILMAVGASNALDKTQIIGKYHDIVWKHRVYGKRDLIMSIIKIMFGILIMTVIGGPFMVSILQLSYAMSIPSFCISFVIVPCCTCGIATVRTIQAPAQKQASLAFSGLYGRVIMNNVAGMTALLSIVYAKGLTFDFSAEVLTTLVVCAIIGTLAFSRKTYAGWTSIVAIILYPSSLVLFCIVQYFWSWN